MLFATIIFSKVAQFSEVNVQDLLRFQIGNNSIKSVMQNYDENLFQTSSNDWKKYKM